MRLELMSLIMTLTLTLWQFIQLTFSALNGATIDPGRRLIMDLWRWDVSYPVEQPGRWVCSCFVSINLEISLPGSI